MAHIFLIFTSLFTCFYLAAPQKVAVQSENVPYAAARGVAVFSVQDTLKQGRQDDKKPRKNKKGKADAKSSKVTMTRAVDRTSLSKRSDAGRQVEVRIMRAGSALRDAEDLQITGNSGNTNTSGNFIGFENIDFPFEGTVRFKAPNKMNSVIYDREVHFVVVEPGSWTLKIDI